MHAYSFDGSMIVSTKDIIPGLCAVQEDGFGVDAAGKPTFEQHDGTNIDWNAQRTLLIRGQAIVVDEAGREWPFCAVVLVDKPLVDELDEDDPEAGILELPADKIAEAKVAYADWKASGVAPPEPAGRTFVIDVPQGGYRHKDSFDAEESRKLRPVAETLAMLDGNAFFGMSRGPDGDDDHYRQYLPEAHALVEANGGWGSSASFIRGDAPLADNPMGLVEIRTIGGERIVDLVDAPDRVLRLSGIDWDTSSDDDVPEGMTPILPTDMLVGVDEDVGSSDNDHMNLVDRLTDRYGFCVNGIGSIETVEEPVDA